MFWMVCHEVRCWEVQDNGQTVPKAQQMHTGPVLDTCWSDVSLTTRDVLLQIKRKMFNMLDFYPGWE